MQLRMTQKRRKALEGYLYISPFLIGFAVFTAYPLIASLYLSFTNFNLLTPPVWVGSGELRPRVQRRQPVLVVTWSDRPVRPAGGAAGRAGVAGRGAAADRGFPGTSLFRTFFFLPSITPIIASVLIWLWILQPSIGVLNYLLSLAPHPRAAVDPEHRLGLAVAGHAVAVEYGRRQPHDRISGRPAGRAR